MWGGIPMDFLALGQVITDDVVFPEMPSRNNLLGGVAYALTGMRLWSDSVAVCCGVGKDFEELHGGWFRANNIDISGLTVLADKGPHSLIRYFEDGEREEISLNGTAPLSMMMPQPDEIPRAFHTCKGIYIFKDAEKAYWERMGSFLNRSSATVVWEILGSAACLENKNNIWEILKMVSIFSINLTECRRLLPGKSPEECVKEFLGAGVQAVLVRMGEGGALVGDRRGIWRIPAVKTEVVDVTGGGNSSTGAFLVGYCESRGNVVLAGKYASVAASFVLEQYGPPHLLYGAITHKAVKRLGELKEERIR